jgi:glycosyltransferase involved in cell wall biosynthesis
MYSVPLVITEHAHVTLYPLIEKKDKVIVRTWNCADALVRVCRKDIPIFSSIFPKEKIFYIPNGYDQGNIKDMTKEEARKILNLPLDKNILFNLAILQNYKGHKYLIEAIQKVLQERSNILCLIGGDGPLKETLEEQIRHLGLEENVKLLGRIPHNEVSHWYSAADIFVLPSINESFGIVQIEAMACGKPVVATYNGGSEEIIISEDYGLLCDSTDSQQLAKNILVALNREWDAEKIRSYARGFTWEKNAEQTVKLFESIIGGQAFQTNEVMRTRSC